MNIELALCIICMMISLPVSRWIGLHYACFAVLNLAYIGVEFADSSILAMSFAAVAIADALIAIYSGRNILLASSACSLALSFESLGDGDLLLSNAVFLSIATNTLIMGSLAKEYLAWMLGKSAH